jgi:GTPase KRas
VKKNLRTIKADCYRKSVVIDEVSCIIETLECSDLRPHQVHWNQVIRDADAFMVVYSIKSRSSLLSIHRYRAQIMGVKNDSPHSVVLIGHEFGEGSKPVEREVAHREGARHARAAYCNFAETSGTNYTDVENIFFDLIRTVRRKRSLPPVCCEPCQCDHGAKC